MRLFRLGIEEQRWDLAAHTLVLAAARLMSNVSRPGQKQGGGRANARRGKDRESARNE